MKVKVLKPFKDTHTQKMIETDENGCIEMSQDRYKEAVKNLSRWPGPFLEIVHKNAPEQADGSETASAAPEEKSASKRGRKKQEG